MRPRLAPSAAPCTRGNSGARLTRSTRAPPPLAPRAFEWRYLDAVVLQRLARHADAVTRLREVLSLVARLSARAASGSRRRCSNPGTSMRARGCFSRSSTNPPRDRPPKSGSDASRRPRASTMRRIEHFERAVTLFPELGAAHYGLALSYRALGRLDEARSALALHEQYRCALAGAGRSGAGHGHDAARRRRRHPAARREACRCRRCRRRDCRARGGARTRPGARPGACEPDFVVRTRPQLVEGRGALSRVRAVRRRPAPTRTTTTACCWACKRSGISRSTPTARRSP